MRDGSARGDVRHALFLHGAGAWGGQWAIWRRVFEAEGWTVATPDLQPAAGGIAATTLDDYRAQVREIAAMQPEGFLLVGASLGGLLAMGLVDEAAQGRAPMPGALMLLNPLPPAPFADELPLDAATSDAVDEAGSAAVAPIRAWHSQGRFDSTRRALTGASFADQQLAFRHWRDESGAALREARDGLALPNLARALTKLPTLVIASDGDTEVPPPLSTRFAEAVGASLLRVPGGHVDPVMGASAAASARSALTWWATAAG